MPIVVRELVVRASVDEANEGNSCSTPETNDKNGSQMSNSGDGATESIIAICVEKVMQAIELKQER